MDEEHQKCDLFVISNFSSFYKYNGWYPKHIPPSFSCIPVISKTSATSNDCHLILWQIFFFLSQSVFIGFNPVTKGDFNENSIGSIASLGRWRLNIYLFFETCSPLMLRLIKIPYQKCPSFSNIRAAVPDKWEFVYL